jgi:hypothetical protein
MPQDFKYSGMIAPCGMNCRLCIGYLRSYKPCGGCFKKEDENKPVNCRSCAIANCEQLVQMPTEYCYECKKFPCTRLKRLDKRYRTKYGMSMIENLIFIQTHGLARFIQKEELKWKCKHCGAGLCVHRKYCLVCQTPYEKVAEA